MDIAAIRGELPHSFAALAEAAAQERVRNVGLLQREWESGVQRFDAGGAALFGAFENGVLTGIGGVTPETGLAEPAMRMRRFYVLPASRRSGTGRALASAAMAHGLLTAPLLTCNARATPLAAPFWEAMGFRPVRAPGYTHIYRA